VDGSTIELNALSTIRVRLSKNTREIDLREGQALFHVAKDQARPFIVRSDGTTVRAVGTQFDVYRKRSGTVVTVLEGRVAVAESNLAVPVLNRDLPAQAPIFLVAGQQVTLPTNDSAKEEPKPRRADVAAATAWVQKRLIFEETPLVEVAEEFNRYSTRRLVIADRELRSMGISGVYSSTDPDSLLGFLRAQPNIQLSETDKEVRVALREKK
jgi:transmembrane sensor